MTASDEEPQTWPSHVCSMFILSPDENSQRTCIFDYLLILSTKLEILMYLPARDMNGPVRPSTNPSVQTPVQQTNKKKANTNRPKGKARAAQIYKHLELHPFDCPHPASSDFSPLANM
jgi:hypothetical protein